MSGMRIGELAEAAGVSVRALRYYEEQGLLDAERTSAGQRRYPSAAVDRVRFIQLLYAAGLSSGRARELLPCWHTGRATSDQRRMLRDELARIRTQLGELRAVEQRLGDLVDATDPAAEGIVSAEGIGP